MGLNKKNFIIGICDKYNEELLEKRVEIEGNTIVYLPAAERL